jgi:hypothetical protein
MSWKVANAEKEDSVPPEHRKGLPMGDTMLNTGFTGDFRIGRAVPVAMGTEAPSDIPRLWYIRSKNEDRLSRAAVLIVLTYVLGSSNLYHCDFYNLSTGTFFCCAQSELDMVMRILADEELDVDVTPFKEVRKGCRDQWGF